jgi:hypothetical protein
VSDPLRVLRKLNLKLADSVWVALENDRARQLRTFDGSSLNLVKSLKVGVAGRDAKG